MGWTRRVKGARKPSTKQSRGAPNLQQNFSSRRSFLKRSAAVASLFAAAAALESCALIITREHGSGKEFDTRRPHSSVKKVVESFPRAGELEIAFFKERRAGILVGASATREKNETLVFYNPLTRSPRSLLHTHPIGPRQDGRVQTYPSPHDFHWIVNRIEGKSSFPDTMRTIHVMPMTREGRAMGFSTIHLGNRWLRVEKESPVFVRKAWDYFSKIQQAYSFGAIPMAEYVDRMNKFFVEMRPFGLLVRVTPYPGFKVENGFLVPAGK